MALFSLNLLEKLTDDRGDEIVHTSVDRLKDSVARDVEALLNSRCGLREGVFEGLPHCQQSVLSFGLKDFVSLCLSSEGDRAAICDDIRRCLVRHALSGTGCRWHSCSAVQTGSPWGGQTGRAPCRGW